MNVIFQAIVAAACLTIIIWLPGIARDLSKISEQLKRQSSDQTSEVQK